MAISVSDAAISSPTTPSDQIHLLNLPNDVLLLILAQAGSNAFNITNVRLVCHTLDDMMRSTPLQVDIVKRYLPVAGAMYRSTNKGLSSLFAAFRHDQCLDINLQTLSNRPDGLSLDARSDLKLIVEMGFCLIGWIAHRARRCSDLSMANVVPKCQLSPAGLLAIAYTIDWLYGTIPCTEFQRIRTEVSYLPLTAAGVTAVIDTNSLQMLIAFQTAVLHNAITCSNRWIFMETRLSILTTTRHVYHAMSDFSDDEQGAIIRNGLLIRGMPCSDPWKLFPSHIRAMANGSRIIGANTDEFSDEDLLSFINKEIKDGKIAQYILQNLDLAEISRNVEFENDTACKYDGL